MPPILTEHQWHLASDDGQVDLVFGTADTGFQTRHAPDLGQRGVRTTDSPLPREDGLGMGYDHTAGQTITFEINVLHDTHLAQADALDLMSKTWHHEAFRNSPQAYGTLRSCVAGRTRRTHGRPRRFAEVDADLTEQGYTGIVCDFASLDGKFYDDEETVETISLIPPSTYGLTDPLTDPLVMPQPAEIPGQITVTGQRTWVRATIHGPVTNPEIDFGDFTIALKTEIPDGQSITIDPRPWSRGVRRSDGANLAKALTYPTPPMRDLKVRPGTYTVTLRGIDATGTSWCEVGWRTAHDRP